jgi:hypothetical protein
MSVEEYLRTSFDSKRAPVHGRPELRVQVTPSRFRVAEFAVSAGPKPAENISTQRYDRSLPETCHFELTELQFHTERAGLFS